MRTSASISPPGAARVEKPMLRRILMRIGHGYDIHRLQDGGELFLGGVIVSRAMSPIAHSDGDVVLHAIVDAMLGAIGGGDIGELFPNSDPQWRNTPSSLFVTTVLGRVKTE